MTPHCPLAKAFDGHPNQLIIMMTTSVVFFLGEVGTHLISYSQVQYNNAPYRTLRISFFFSWQPKHVLLSVHTALKGMAIYNLWKFYHLFDA